MFPNLFMTIIIFNSLYAKQKQQHFINFSHPSPSVSGNLQSIFCVYELRVFYLKKFFYIPYIREIIFFSAGLFHLV